MKFAVIGAGGVGGYYGGMLARAGNDVTFVARGEQFTALATNGLSIKSVDDEFHVSVNVVKTISELTSPYVILVATKTYDRDDVAFQLQHVANDSTIIIPLLNGIDNDVQIRKKITRGRVFPGLTYIISARVGPGKIAQTAGPRTIFFGDRENPQNPELLEIESAMRAAKILATTCSDIDKELWEKFLWITTFSGMTAICRSSIGFIVNDPQSFAIYLACLEEGFAVARAMGITVDSELRAKLVKKAEEYKHSSQHAKSSLLIDIENQRRTEIDALSGTIVRFGKEHGVPTPLHELIYCGIKTASESYRANKTHE